MKLNLKLKLLITTFVLFMLLFSSFCFATDSDTMQISNEINLESIESNIRDSDLYVANESQYEIKNTINGNVFISVDTLNIDPTDNGGIIEGNLFAVASTVNIKSDATYSDTEKDDIGNPTVTVNNSSVISGNAFITANKVVLDPGCKIYGDLYICADEVILAQNSIIYGNVFIVSNKFELNSEIGGSLYATVKSFDMKYYGFVSRDLHLTAETANLNGYVYRNSFITVENLTTDDKFINQNNFTITDADNVSFSGEIIGNASINAKTLNFKNTDNGSDLICKISGNLSYSSNQEIDIPDGIVSGEISYSSYTSTSSNSILSNIWNYILSLITLLICVYIIYLLVTKFAPNYLNKISNISGLNLLKYLGIGIGFLIAIPLICVLLFIIRIGTILGFILLLIYALVLIIAKPIFIVSIAKFAKEKLSNKINIYLYILATAVILSLISLIPYVGFVVSLLVYLAGIGMMIKGIFTK